MAGKRGRRRAPGAAAGRRLSPRTAGATGVRAWTQESEGPSSDALLRRGCRGQDGSGDQQTGSHNDPRGLELGDSSGVGRTGQFLDIY